MKAYGHIVAAIDLVDEDKPVVRRSKEFARRTGARLSVVSVLRPIAHVYGGFDLALDPHFEQRLHTNAQARLDQICRELGVSVDDAHVISGTPPDALVGFAKANAIDLIAIGTHDRDVAEFFLGTKATSVLHHAHCDVLGVRLAGAGKYDRVIVAIDGSADSEFVLDRLKSLVTATTDVRVVIVLRPLFAEGLDPDDFAEDYPLKDIVENMEQGIIQAAKHYVDNAGIAGARLEVLYGTPSKKIKAYAADERAGLVVMGSGEHVGLGWMIGSTTNNVLTGVECDALVVRRPPHGGA